MYLWVSPFRLWSSESGVQPASFGFSSRSSKTLTVCELIWLIILYDSYTNFNQPIGYRNKILSSTYLFSSRQVRNIFGKFSKFNYGWVQVWHWWPTLYSGHSREIRNRKRVDNIIFMNYTYRNYIFIPDKGESEGYTVKSKEEEFPISNYPLLQSDFLYSQKQGIASWNDFWCFLPACMPTAK